MKKLTSLLLALIMMITVMMSSALSVFAASFEDVKKSDWFYDSVNYVADKGIMKGTSSTEFAPNTTLSRAMAVTLLYRIAKTPSVSGVKLLFGDVKNGQWYTDAVKWAYDNGVVKGKSSTVFGTDDNITRADFVTIIYRYTVSANLMVPNINPGNYPSDLADIPSYAFEAVTTLFKGDVIKGREDRRFDSYANISRAEAASIIERYSKKVTKYVPNSDVENTIKAETIPTTGNLVVKEKKYNYKGANVMIMNIENQTDKNITLTITAEFKDSKGNVLKTETRKVEGFPANYRNYVVFQPGIKFDKFTYEIKTSSFSGTTYAKCLAFDTETTAKLVACISKPGEGEYPKGQERAGISFRVRSANTYNTTLYVGWDEIFFDNKGNIYYIGEFGGAISNQFVSYKDRQCVFH
ncbi:MAG: S-layer homology domain-containing protein, partial [Clostridia bacterium]|nr:S-layer homology domain-containing protein [Clostridia bacterium]